jgi:hypothetical protein
VNPNPDPVCVCLLLQDLVQSCLHGGVGGDMGGHGGGCGLGWGVGGLGGPRAGVDGLWHLCCSIAVAGPFAGGRPSVFQRSQSLLVRWVDAWGCGGGLVAAWASSGLGQLQQACGFTSV